MGVKQGFFRIVGDQKVDSKEYPVEKRTEIGILLKGQGKEEEL